MIRGKGPAAAILGAAAVALLVVAHVVTFGVVSARVALPAAVAGGAVLGLLAAHVGLLRPLGAWLARRRH